MEARDVADTSENVAPASFRGREHSRRNSGSRFGLGDDPLPPTAPSRVHMSVWELVAVEGLVAFVGYLAALAVGLALKVASYEGDVAREVGETLLQEGLGCILLACWQLWSSTELAYRRWKYAGLALAVVLFLTGVVLVVLVSREPVSPAHVASSTLLGIGVGPFLTTVLLLEPREKETLAMPYVNNFVLPVAASQEVAAGGLCVLIPRSAATCAELRRRLAAYKRAGCITETQLSLPGAHKKFSVDGRGGKLLDVPSMLDGATQRKVQLFHTTLCAYLDDLRSAASKRRDQALLDCISRIHVRIVEDFTLRQVDLDLYHSELEGRAHTCRCLRSPQKGGWQGRAAVFPADAAMVLPGAAMQPQKPAETGMGAVNGRDDHVT